MAVGGLAFLAYSGVAQASLCQTNCSATDPEAAQISQTPATSATAWSGEPYAASFEGAQFCDSRIDDPGNGLCDRYEVTTQDPGPVRVTVTWADTANTFWLLVCLVPPVGSLQTSTDDCGGPVGLGGTLVAKDLNQFDPNSNFDTLTFTPVPGTTYEVRVIPAAVAPDPPTFPGPEIYQGCAGYTAFNNCAAPSSSTTPPAMTSTCSTSQMNGLMAEFATTANRRIQGGGDIADSTGNLKEHFSFRAEQETEGGQDPVEGQINYKNDGELRFKSRWVTCASFYDEGYDPQGDPKGSTEFRGQGTLKLDSGTTLKNECFRAFGRGNGDHPSGSDQFNIDFTAPQSDGSCVFSGDLSGRTITHGNVEYTPHE